MQESEEINMRRSFYEKVKRMAQLTPESIDANLEIKETILNCLKKFKI